MTKSTDVQGAERVTFRHFKENNAFAVFEYGDDRETISVFLEPDQVRDLFAAVKQAVADFGDK